MKTLTTSPYAFFCLLVLLPILSLRVPATPIVQINEAEFYDKVYACWLGKNIGGTLGMPFEGDRNTHTVTYYTNLSGQPAANDDLDLQLVWLKAMQDHNATLDCRILGQYWLEYIWVDWAEYGVAKMNMRRGILPPLSGEYDNGDAKHSNGAWIRSEIWACLAPGSPGQAARFAREDACVDHGAAEGTIAELFTASIESAAFVQSDRDTLINIGLSMIPANSRVAVAVRTVLAAKAAGKDWLQARQDVINATEDTGWFQAPRDVAFMIIGWVYGNGDFGQSICTAVNCGDDTDCTGATLGSILGIIGGTSAIPQEWKDPIGTNIDCVAITGLTHPNDLGTLADQTVALTKQVQSQYNLPVGLTTGATDLSRVSDLNLSDTVTAQALWALSPYRIVWNEADEQVTLDYQGDPVILATLARSVTVTVKNLTGSAKAYNIALTGVPADWPLSGLPTQATLAAGEEKVLNIGLSTSGIQAETRMTVVVTGGATTVNVPITLFGRGAPPVVPGTIYRISSKLSGKCVSVENQGTADGANVYQWDWSTNAAQLWRVEDPAGSVYFKLSNLHSGKYLTIDSANPGADGDNIYQWSGTNSDRQLWQVEDIGGGYYRITCKGSGKCVSVTDSLLTNGANIQQWSWLTADAQGWSFTVASPPPDSVSVALVSPTNNASYTAPATILLQANASTATGSLALVEFFSGTTRLGESLTEPYSFTWSNVPPGTYTLTARASNAVGNVAVSPAVAINVIGPLARINVTPNNVTVGVGRSQQFSATAADALGTPINPPPAFAWSVSGGGQINSNGLFTAGGQFGGPFTISASSGSIMGTATVSLVSEGRLSLPFQATQVVSELSMLLVTNTALGGALTTQIVTNTYSFTYADRTALLADGWNFVATAPNGSARNSETTSGAVVSFDQSAHPGILRIPCDVGDLWGTPNNTRNSLFRVLPTNWVSLRVAFSLWPQADYQQGHLALYQDDDNYLQVGLVYNHYQGGEELTMDLELGGAPNTFSQTPASLTNLQLRLDQDIASGVVTGLFSPEGTNWTVLGTSSRSLTNPRLSLWAGSYQAPYGSGSPTFDLRRLEIVLTNNTPAVLNYRLVKPPAGAQVDTNGIITWTPTEAQGPATNVLTTVVSDGTQSATNAVTVVVTEVNSPPRLPPQGEVTIAALCLLTVTNTATDPDLPANTLSYRLINPPTGAQVDTNGVITWTPTQAQAPSTNLFRTVVSDDGLPFLSATNSFAVFVLEPTISWPVIQSVVFSSEVVTISWTALAGRTYRLQYKEDLAQANWLELPPDVTATGPTASATDNIPLSPARFYRVLLLP